MTLLATEGALPAHQRIGVHVGQRIIKDDDPCRRESSCWLLKARVDGEILEGHAIPTHARATGKGDRQRLELPPEPLSLIRGQVMRCAHDIQVHRRRALNG